MENDWSGSRESRKRSLAEISQSHTRSISSSPVLVRERPSNFGSSSSRLPPPANNPASTSQERRHIPNNNSISGQSSRPLQSLRTSAEMEASSRPAPLQNRPEFVIDLTSDQEDAPAPVEPPRRANRMHAFPRPPPRLGRGEARLEQVVDLTADDDDDDTIVITHSRERSIPLPRETRLPPMPRLVGHFARMGQPVQLGGRATPPTFRAGHDNGNQMEPPRPPPGRISGGFRALYENGADIIMDIHNFMGLGRANLVEDDHVDFHFFGMPNELDYGRVALQNNQPEFVAPPPVGAGFTRSPTESDTAICPSCEEELIHRKDAAEPLIKKARGPPSRKDREEHPFWVVKDCGHVFCNKCYQHRNNDKLASFRGPKNSLCAVENCESNIKTKDRWVGVFL
ncbi:hypothetical protein DID88_001429 [Monilinia fructigena]|uniref:RING-type domain-containing protein n=1 Tax=Monilinia fructigena TaxID=38457 RepID=A0A395IZH0_9HELO|nr:hypothetical protein DID88_001429 [Monilinia fructigena]